jgi:hypothetical protein
VICARCWSRPITIVIAAASSLAKLAQPNATRTTAGLPPDPDGPAAHAIYQVTPAVLGRRRATQREPVRPPSVRQWQRESARRRPRTNSAGRTSTDPSDSLSLSGKAPLRSCSPVAACLEQSGHEALAAAVGVMQQLLTDGGRTGRSCIVPNRGVFELGAVRLARHGQ